MPTTDYTKEELQEKINNAGKTLEKMVKECKSKSVSLKKQGESQAALELKLVLIDLSLVRLQLGLI
jgi:hypothetical protein